MINKNCARHQSFVRLKNSKILVWIILFLSLRFSHTEYPAQHETLQKMSYLTNFTVETGRAILVEIIKTVNQPENSKTISMAKASAGKEMIAMMQLVFPLVMKIQTDVITNFGFPGM